MRKTLIVAVVAVAALFVVAPNLHAQADVVNYGHDGATCFIAGLGSVWEPGKWTRVETPSGNVNLQCTDAELSSGPGVSETQVIRTDTCVFRLLKSGRANANCHFRP